MREHMDKWTFGSPFAMCRTYPRLLANILALRIEPDVLGATRGGHRWGRALTFAVTTLVLYALLAAVGEVVLILRPPQMLMGTLLRDYLREVFEALIPLVLFNLCLIPLQAAFLVVSVGAMAVLSRWRQNGSDEGAVPTGIIVLCCCPALVAPILRPFSQLSVAGVWGYGVLAAYVALGVPFLIQGAFAGLLYSRFRLLPARHGLTLGVVAALMICAPLPWYYSAIWKLYMHAVIFVHETMYML